MLFPVSDERDHVRPADARDGRADPRVTAWHVVAMAVLAVLASAGGFGLANLYFGAVAAESREHDARLRAEIRAEIRREATPAKAVPPAPAPDR